MKFICHSHHGCHAIRVIPLHPVLHQHMYLLPLLPLFRLVALWPCRLLLFFITGTTSCHWWWRNCGRESWTLHIFYWINVFFKFLFAVSCFYLLITIQYAVCRLYIYIVLVKKNVVFETTLLSHAKPYRNGTIQRSARVAEKKERNRTDK